MELKDFLGMGQIIKEQQAEIERLRAELKKVQEAWYGRCVIIDERDAEIEQLRTALRDLVERWSTERGYDGAIQRASALLLEYDLRSPATEDVRRAINTATGKCDD